MKSCPRCKLESPNEASRCDCGYDFETKKIEKSYLPANNEGLSPKELFHARVKAIIWLVVTIILFILHAGYLINGMNFIASLFFLLPVIFTTSRYAVCKGYDWTWGFLGIFHVLGLAILITKPYKIRWN